MSIFVDINLSLIYVELEPVMIEIEFPDNLTIQLSHMALDVNGTICTDGFLIEGVKDRIQALRKDLQIHILTANTHGRQKYIDDELGLSSVQIASGGEAEQKMKYIENIGFDSVIAVGNGVNDRLMLKKAAIGIVVIGEEGAAISAILNADVICRHIHDAFDLLLRPKRLIASLRR